MRELCPPTLADMVAECDEELRYRASVYDRRKANAGLALRNQLDRKVEVMKAIRAHLAADLEIERGKAK
jgi:hypothetical protein